MKVSLTVFFDCNDVVHHEFLSQVRTVSKEYYLEIMRRKAKQFVSKAQNCGKINHGLCIMITRQLTHQCLCVNLWPKTKPKSCHNHRIHGIWLPLTFSSS